jgi:hypothetical protein
LIDGKQPGTFVSCQNSRSFQTTRKDYFLEPATDSQNCVGWPLLKHLVEDQKAFWTAPTRLKKKDAKWGLPLLGFNGVLIASDSWLSKQVPDKPNQLRRSQDFSNYALYSLMGTAG